MANFIQENEQLPLFAPTVSLHEVFVGGARPRGEEGVKDARNDLDWVEPLELSVDGSAEAALINPSSMMTGKISERWTLIAGMVRDTGRTLVTRNSHFDHVDDLDVETY